MAAHAGPKHAAPKGPKHAGPRATGPATTAPNGRHSGGPRHAAPKPASGIKPQTQARINKGAQTVSKPVVGGFNLAVSAVPGVGRSAVNQTGKALPFLLAATFLIIALAKIRGGGKHTIDIPRAFFGGLILAFFLTMLSLWNAHLATLFAGLVFIGVTIEFAPTAFGGLFTGKTVPLNDSGAQGFIDEQTQAVLGNPPPAMVQTPPGSNAAATILNPNR